MNSLIEPQSLSVVVQQVVAVSGVRGDGTQTSPRRMVTQYWSLSGDMLAEFDSLVPTPDLLGALYLAQQEEIRALRRLVSQQSLPAANDERSA